VKKALLVAIAFALAIPLGFAQQVTSPITPEATGPVPVEQRATSEDILALMDVMHSRRQMAAMLDSMKRNMLEGMRLSFLKEHPGASPVVLSKLDATMDGVWKVINLDELVAAGIPVYQKYLTHEDAIGLISFYSSPAGQHYLARMPALIKESSEVGGNVMKGHLDEIQRDAKLKFEQFEKYVAAHPEELGDAPAKE
jgi:hypothetical protein